MKMPWNRIGLWMLLGVFVLASCTRKVTVEQLLSDEPNVQSSALKRVNKISDEKKAYWFRVSSPPFKTPIPKSPTGR